MAELNLQPTIIDLRDLPVRPKALDEESQDDVLGGYFNANRFRQQLQRRQQQLRSRFPRWGQQSRGPQRQRRRVPVYAWRRVQVGWRFV